MKHILRILAVLALCNSLFIQTETVRAQSLFGPAGALRFDGLDDQVVVSSNSSLTLGNRATFEAWIFPQAAGTIVSRGDGGNLAITDYILQVTNIGGLKLGFMAAGAWDYSVATIPSNVWTHVAVTYDGTNKQFFINGVVDSTASRPGTFYASGLPVYIGRQGSVCNCSFFKGQIDELRFWNTVRTTNEISLSRTQSLTGTEAGLAAYYRFDHISGVYLRDSSTNGNSGKLVNRPVPVPSTVPFPLLVSPNGANPLTNDCNVAFTDPGAAVRSAPVALLGFSTHNGALRGDGSVVRWSASSLIAVAPDETNLVAACVSASGELGLRANGVVIARGDNSYGQTNVPPNLTNAVAIAVGFYHYLALKADGTVVAWGDNSTGATNVPGSAVNVVGIAAGYQHSVALRADGSLVAWGNNTVGELNIPSNATNVVKVVCGGHHSLALRADGTLVAWGYNSYGQVNIPADATNIVAIAADDQTSLALKANGTVVLWGNFDPSFAATNLTGVVAIGGGSTAPLALKADGTLVAMTTASFKAIPPEAYFQSVSVSSSGSVNPGTFGTYPISYSATNSTGATGSTNRTVVVADITPPRVNLLGANPLILYVGDAFVDPGATATDYCAGDMTGSIVASGTVNTNVPGRYQRRYSVTDPNGNTGTMFRAVIVFSQPFISLLGGNPLTNECHVPFVDPGAGLQSAPVGIGAGFANSCAIKFDRTVRVWGATNSNEQAIPPNATNVISVTAGDQFIAALRGDGTIVAWGDEAPVVSGISNVIAISSRDSDLLALKADGTVTNLLNYVAVPASVSNAVSISMGGSHGIASRSDGTVIAWGANDSGQTNVPASAVNVVQVAAGGNHSLALKADGTLVAWGTDSYGVTNIPPNATNVVAISAGYSHNLVLKNDGTVVTWGYGGFGLTNVPGSVTNVIAIATGSSHSVVERADGTIIAWGYNAYGQTNVPFDVTLVLSATVTNGTVDPNVPGNYFLTYIATNGSGGPVTNSRTVVVFDSRRPTISLVGTNPITLIAGSPFVDPGATATDLCAGTLTSSIVASGTVNNAVPGAYTRTYSVTDPSGNNATTNRSVVVVGAPSLSGFTASLIATNPDTAVVTAQLGADVIPNGLLTTAYLQYGLTPSYTVSSTSLNFPGVFAASNFTTVAANLSRGVVYHWRAVGSNSVGTTFGPDQVIIIPGLYPAGDLNGDGRVSESEFSTVLSNYFVIGQGQGIQIGNVAGLGSANVSFGFTNAFATGFSVETSSNLFDWIYLGPATSRYGFSDTNAPGPKRFYRLRWP